MGVDKHEKNRAKGKLGHHTILLRKLMDTQAWRSLSSKAQALYPWIRLEWKGEKFNNNGDIQLSVRQAAEKMGVSKDTASKAFQELQAKGFIVVTKLGELGIDGMGKSPTYEITELIMPNAKSPRSLFSDWELGNDFEVQKISSNNPTGRREKPVIKTRTLLS